MIRSLMAVLPALLAGCAYTLALHPRDGSEVGTGRADATTKTVEIQLHGRTYKGPYVYDGGTVIPTTSYGTGMVGARAISTTSFGTAYAPGSGNGRVLATSTQGDALRCEFSFRGTSGLGVCEDNAGKAYDLVIGK